MSVDSCHYHGFVLGGKQTFGNLNVFASVPLYPYLCYGMQGRPPLRNTFSKKFLVFQPVKERVSLFSLHTGRAGEGLTLLSVRYFTGVCILSQTSGERLPGVSEPCPLSITTFMSFQFLRFISFFLVSYSYSPVGGIICAHHDSRLRFVTF